MGRGDGQLSLHLLANGNSSRHQAKDRKRALPRLSVSPDEAAEMLSVSRDYFDEHILPDLRIIRRGRRILVPLTQLERWLDQTATSVAATRSR